ncbi:MAG: PIN domain-containing protein [Rhodothermales bacterium]
MSVLVDSSVWIAYFRGDTGESDNLDFLIEENLVFVNHLILSEIVPPLRFRRKHALVKLLDEVPRHPMSIDWEDLIRMQVACLRNGINRVGIPDLIIAQHAVQNELRLFTLDEHFRLIEEHFGLEMF